MGQLYMNYVFQFSFASTATTIVSGAAAERMSLLSYLLFRYLPYIHTFVYRNRKIPQKIVFSISEKFSARFLSCFNIFAYVVPVSWVWRENGFLKELGFNDFAGACVVHVNGGASGLVAALMLGPRLGVFTKSKFDYSLLVM